MIELTNVILYPRKSREDIEREKESGEDCLATMTGLLETTCKRMGIAYTKDDIFPEIGSADTIDGRPVFSRIINELLPSGRYQGIVVREISRLGRGNFTDAGRIYDTLIKHKIYIITPTKTYDPTNKDDLKFLRMQLFMAREEYEMIKDRLWYGKDERAKQGFSPGNIVTLGIESIRGKIIIIKGEAELVLRIFKMRAGELNYQEISGILNKEGYRTKRGFEFRGSTIYKVLHNKRYIGIARWSGEEYPSQNPAIVPLELWNKVHNQINPSLFHKKQAHRDNEYLVELYCGECGNRMYGSMYQPRRQLRSGEKKYYTKRLVYVCNGRKLLKLKCPTPQQNADDVHEIMFDELKKVLANKRMLKKAITKRQTFINENIDSISGEIGQKEKLLKQKQNFLLQLDRDFKNEDLTARLYSKNYDETCEEIDTIKSEIANLSTVKRRNTVKTDPVDNILYRVNYLIESWDLISNKTKKAVFAAFFPKIEIGRDGITADVTFPLSLDF